MTTNDKTVGERFCNKCGYWGPDVLHQRPNGSGQCGYLSCLTTPSKEPAGAVAKPFAWVPIAKTSRGESNVLWHLATESEWVKRRDLEEMPHEIVALYLAAPGAAIDAREQEVKIAPVPYDKHEAEILAVIDERDRYHDMADQLAAQIAAITGDEIGEHSSDNDPWHNAMLSADEWIARDLRAMFSGDAELHLKVLRAKIASREEAPPASASPATVAQPVADEVKRLREALQFYADGNHFTQHQPDAWDTVSDEPSNFYEDESNTATVEDGSVAKMALAAQPCPSQGCGGAGSEAIADAQIDAAYKCFQAYMKWSKEDDRHRIEHSHDYYEREAVRAALKGTTPGGEDT